MIRLVVAALAVLAAAAQPAPARAAGPAPPTVPLATVGGPVASGAPASVFRPAPLRSEFRIPRSDTALYIAAPPRVRDLAITIVGPQRHRQTIVATTELPGHVLGLRVPPDAWIADRVELEGTAVAGSDPPFLVSAEQLADLGWQTWWYAVLFGLFLALAVIYGVLAAVVRSRAFAWFAATTAVEAGLLVAPLGVVRPPPEVSQPFHAAMQSLVYVALTLFTFAYLRGLRIRRWAAVALWALVGLNVAIVCGGDLLQDFWPVPDAVVQALAIALNGAYLTLGIVALRRGRGDDGEAYYVAAGAVALASSFFAFAPRGGMLVEAVPLLGVATQAVVLAVGLLARLASLAREGFRAPAPVRQIDGLTGIANRAAFDEALPRAWDRARRARSPLAALLLDIDHFKEYNDLYGHHAGDDALRRIADAIAQTVTRRHDDVAARYGGEEFVVLLPDTDLAGAQRVAHGLLFTVEALAIAQGNVPAKRLSVSIGVAALVPESEDAGEGGELLRRASNALYVAKTMGRNRVVADEPAEPAEPNAPPAAFTIR